MRSKEQIDAPLFVWSCEEIVNYDPYSRTNDKAIMLKNIYGDVSKRCPFCAYRYNVKEWEVYTDYFGTKLKSSHHNGGRCKVCGFFFDRYTTYRFDGFGFNDDSLKFAQLKKFSINSGEVTLTELASHLKRNYSDVFNLAPYRFEQLVGQIYKGLNYEVTISKASKDGGVDLILVENDSGEKILVQCKRYARHRKVGVSLVRELLGVQLTWGVPKAKLVTTSTFTSGAKREAKSAMELSRVTLDLVDAGELLHHLQVYNNKLPPLHLELKSRELIQTHKYARWRSWLKSFH